MAELLRSLRQHGLDKSKSNGLRIGLNSRFGTIQAAILLCKLDLLEEEIIQRVTAAETYSRLLNGIVAFPTVCDGIQPAWGAYTIRTQQRDVVKKHLSDSGIYSAIYYTIPFHEQFTYQGFPVIDGPCPVAKRACDEVLSLPMGPYLDFTTQTRIANAIKEALKEP
ncbi:putative aminotransferase [Rosellinia necatrix]|uniref:Putative aminotransferase n=1 Tax=Rosellinia necatrix TaxID=77044 RepID=A0A1S8ABK6_ROSNE|nr:putative aminotransferase [Rosellinia necatrix]